MKKYFEGWYFKIVDKSGKYKFAIIPGVSFARDGNGVAFIQVFDGSQGIMNYLEYEMKEFEFNEDKFEIWIEDNYFSSNYMDLSIRTDKLDVSGTISFDQMKSWPVSILEPGVMGWYRYVPMMECYHGIVSFDHTLSGSLTIDGRQIVFDEGKGYIEKDYGRSFPEYYIWAQSNHFGLENTSLMVSIAKIPWFFSHFDGFIAGFFLKGELYKFTTYSGAKISYLTHNNNTTHVTFETKDLRLELVISRKNEGTHLQAPIDGSMTGRILESMNAEIKTILTNKKENHVLFDGMGIHAGYDVGGKIEKLKEIDNNT